MFAVQFILLSYYFELQLDTAFVRILKYAFVLLKVRDHILTEPTFVELV